MDVQGVVQGDHIKLDKPLSQFEGMRVIVHVEIADNDRQVSPEEQQRAWDEWAAHGPQGPIDDDSDWP